MNKLQTMLDMQLSLQQKVNEKYPHRRMNPTELVTCGEILDCLQRQDDFIADETRELYTSLGGDSNGRESSAVWKPWKANHDEFRNRRFVDLSEEDQKAVKMEFTDKFHFIMVQMLALGIDADELFELYCEKNAENFKRQEENY